MKLLSIIVYFTNHSVTEVGSFHIIRLGALGPGWVEGETASDRGQQTAARGQNHSTTFFFLNKF